MKRVACAVALLALCAPPPARAWGQEGHRVVAAIAATYLRPDVALKVDRLLATDADTLTPHDLQSAATWADAWRNRHRETSQWHFTDIELDHPDLSSACFGHPPPA